MKWAAMGGLRHTGGTNINHRLTSLRPFLAFFFSTSVTTNENHFLGHALDPDPTITPQSQAKNGHFGCRNHKIFGRRGALPPKCFAMHCAINSVWCRNDAQDH